MYEIYLFNVKSDRTFYAEKNYGLNVRNLVLMRNVLRGYCRQRHPAGQKCAQPWARTGIRFSFLVIRLMPLAVSLM